MKVLITSDNHLGFKETDPIRREDTFNTFEEILNIAKQENVDFVIQGGDLFDENKPSRNTYNKTVKLLRQYCLGEIKPQLQTSIQYNWHDQNLNVQLPIFSIHGNHDDPSGFNAVSPLDVINSSGLINYFGKCENVDDIFVEPILLEKNNVKIALYGIGHIKDRRIYKTFKSGAVRYKRPEGDNWYNILVVHQNRTPRENEYLPEDFIDPLFDLVIYGHEHESLKIQHKNFEVIQVGSSVRTSLSEGESYDKYAYILEIGDKAHIKRITLQTVRPFIMESIKIKDVGSETIIKNKLESMIQEARQKVNKNIADSSLMLPLMRLRVEIEGEKVFNKHKIVEFLKEHTANASDVLKITRKPIKTQYKSKPSVKKLDVADIYYDVLLKTDLNTLARNKVIDSLKDFIFKENKEAFSNLVKTSIESIVNYIGTETTILENLENEIKNANNFLNKVEGECIVKNEDEMCEISSDLTPPVQDLNSFLSQMNTDSSKLKQQGNSSIFSVNSDFSNKNSVKDFTFIEDIKAVEENQKICERIKIEQEERKSKKLKESSTDDCFFTFTKYL